MIGRAIVFGGYGTFGHLVSRELAARGVAVTVAGRDRGKAEALAAELATVAGEHRGLAVDQTDAAALPAALDGHAVAVSCAGPFRALGAALLDACLVSKVHYADIADDRLWARGVRARGAEFAASSLVAAWGCSSLPAISGALALSLTDGKEAIDRARVTLFIGNDNPKGAAAIRSAVGVIGRPIEAPQGTLVGFRGREIVDLPAPFGRRAVYDFESPEYDLFPSLIGARAVSVKVGFELRVANLGFALLARLGSRWGAGTARFLDATGGALRGVGCAGGAVMVELLGSDGARRAATLVSPDAGQRMAALPCALVVTQLCKSTSAATSTAGALTAYELLGARPLLDGMVAAGFQLVTTS